MTTLAAIETVIRTFAILLSKRANVEASLVKLAKRCAKKGLPVLTWSWGKAYASTVTAQFFYINPIVGYGVPDGYPVVGHSGDGTYCLASVPADRVDLTIEGDTPRFAGWRFVAALQHLEGENLVRSLPGATVPEAYRTRGPQCDHCGYQRRRNDTFVLSHEDGRTIQIGSTCIGDFLGTDDAGSIAAHAEFLALARAFAEEGCEGWGNGSSDRLLSDFLPFVAWEVRANGWTSRTKAREEGAGVATANMAWRYLTDRQAASKAGAAPSEEDTATAVAAAEWAESLTDEAVNAEQGDYLHNLRAVAHTGLASHRTAGIAASAVIAYQRHIGKERAKAAIAAPPKCDTYVGTIGAKVTFGRPVEVTKKGAPKKGAPTVLSTEPVTLVFVTGYQTDFGYTTILKFRTSEGAIVVWKASNTEIDRACVGKRYTLAGTVKDHAVHKGEKQTVLTRCGVIEVPADVASDAA